MGELSAELNRLQKMRHPNVCDFLGEGLRVCGAAGGMGIQATRHPIEPPGFQAPGPHPPGQVYQPHITCSFLRPNVRAISPQVPQPSGEIR